MFDYFWFLVKIHSKQAGETMRARSHGSPFPGNVTNKISRSALQVGKSHGWKLGEAPYFQEFLNLFSW